MHPFGDTITDTDIRALFNGAHGWEARYKTLIKLAKQLPPLADEHKVEDNAIHGCESQAWLVSELNEKGVWQFHCDSDARIVKGLMTVVLAALSNKTAEQIQAFDMEAYFSELQLLPHLSPSRGNGLRAVVTAIKTKADS
ncbi:cysteine desulfurase sulfur acceptor subunit CsdE [Oceanisphaera arctica]|uniref:Cysteine desulfurase, sulfur acceptor subunit CsdE n=1 Tax=Oceanisphaera arctica TaxID=641510 RepID=A0A2P5TNX3_9GAMM|nr:cysteine desulfurase sulfur acceptor subunit CsdE [Oceanisphaera arctica]PPL17277.1 cysteine desulfurase, sulfur acceptor subunit CsdE [Oceanisphaera arctica]GHA20065.1 SufE protein [Oceanisphaera arctica]